MWIQHSSVINSFLILREDCFGHQGLYVDIGLHQCSEMGWDFPHLGRLNAIIIDQTSYLYAAAFRQIIDQPIIAHVAINDTRLVGPNGVDNRAGILIRLFNIDPLGRFIFVEFFLPIGHLLHAALRILVNRNAITLDQIRAARLNKPRGIFGKVLR
ncbi:hypothetical protein D3C73_1218630 [compost metagenome]